MIPHVILCLAYQRDRMAYQNSSSNPYIIMLRCSDTISEMTTFVISLMVYIATPLHDNNYRGLMTNTVTPSFLVGTQDIFLSPLPFYTIPIFLFKFPDIFLFTI